MKELNEEEELEVEGGAYNDVGRGTYVLDLEKANYAHYFYPAASIVRKNGEYVYDSSKGARQIFPRAGKIKVKTIGESRNVKVGSKVRDLWLVNVEGKGKGWINSNLVYKCAK